MAQQQVIRLDYTSINHLFQTCYNITTTDYTMCNSSDSMAYNDAAVMDSCENNYQE